jgi:hypothetical protein
MRLRAPPLVLAGIAVLVAANIWLLSMVVGQIVTDDKAVADEARWIPHLAKLDTGEAHATSATAHQDILAHPVFAKSRAPFVPPPPPIPKAPPTPAPVLSDPGFSLGGVMLSGDTKRAYLLQKTNQRGAWAGEGDDVAGWKLESITAETATLRKESHVIELRLYPER